MMPKGVEHEGQRAGRVNCQRVRIPMMPKGVEHLLSGVKAPPLECVRIPMMPKGVEHIEALHSGLIAVECEFR